jgi:adenine-specific DNA-methyltransferase
LVYEDRLSWEMLGGDLFLPFLDRALEALRPQGKCGFICSDRWLHMAFAERFRRKWSSRITIVSNDPLQASQAFIKDVDSYPTIFVASKAARKPSVRKASKESSITLAEAGYRVRVGPALGHTPAFVLEPDEHDVEPRLLTRWIDASEILEGTITWQGRRVIALHDKKGQVIDPKRYPRLRARLRRFRKPLTKRSIVADGAPWFRTIDRVIPQVWTRPKLLVPELAKVPRLAIDRSGAIPSHGVYAIFAPDDDVDRLYELLRDGKLAAALDGVVPTVRGGVFRCYKRFLDKIRLPLGG